MIKLKQSQMKREVLLRQWEKINSHVGFKFIENHPNR